MDYSHRDYRPGPVNARYNAEVFRAIWNREVVGVEDEGIFFTTDSGGGHMQASELAQEISDTDQSRLLTMDDCIDAAGQLLRATPPMFYEPVALPPDEGVHPSWNN